MIAEALLSHQRRAHVRYRRDPIVVGQFRCRHELHSMALLVESTQIQEAEIGTATAAGAQHPGTHGERFDVVQCNVA
jgi:hypothetical protein